MSPAVRDAHFHATQSLQLATRDTNTLLSLSIHYRHLAKSDLAIKILEQVMGLDQDNGFAAFLAKMFPYACTARCSSGRAWAQRETSRTCSG